MSANQRPLTGPRQFRRSQVHVARQVPRYQRAVTRSVQKGSNAEGIRRGAVRVVRRQACRQAGVAARRKVGKVHTAQREQR